jgi:hypothetical protein
MVITGGRGYRIRKRHRPMISPRPYENRFARPAQHDRLLVLTLKVFPTPQESYATIA